MLSSHDTFVAATPAIDTDVPGARASDALNVTTITEPTVAGLSEELIVTDVMVGAVGSTESTEGPNHCDPGLLVTTVRIAV